MFQEERLEEQIRLFLEAEFVALDVPSDEKQILQVSLHWETFNASLAPHDDAFIRSGPEVLDVNKAEATDGCFRDACTDLSCTLPAPLSSDQPLMTSTSGPSHLTHYLAINVSITTVGCSSHEIASKVRH